MSAGIFFTGILIGLVTFFLANCILKRFIKTDIKRTIVNLAITIVATPLIYFCLVRLFIFLLTYSPTKDFDSHAWFADKQTRYQMAGDIVNSKMLIAKDSLAIKKLLGEPTFRAGNLNNSWVYDMGTGGGGLVFLMHNLHISFTNGQVTAVSHQEIRD